MPTITSLETDSTRSKKTALASSPTKATRSVRREDVEEWLQQRETSASVRSKTGIVTMASDRKHRHPLAISPGNSQVWCWCCTVWFHFCFAPRNHTNRARWCINLIFYSGLFYSGDCFHEKSYAICLLLQHRKRFSWLVLLGKLCISKLLFCLYLMIVVDS